MVVAAKQRLGPNWGIPLFPSSYMLRYALPYKTGPKHRESVSNHRGGPHNNIGQLGENFHAS
jgi:hypothetical protein